VLIFAPCGLSNLVAQSDQLAPLLIQMSGVRREQRKQDLIGHGEVMLKAIHLAPRTHKLRNTLNDISNAQLRYASSDVGRQRNEKRAVWH
jgi:hypothetical protein